MLLCKLVDLAMIRNSQPPSQQGLKTSQGGYICSCETVLNLSIKSNTKLPPRPLLRQKSNNNTVNETTVFTLFDTVKSALTDCYRAISCFIKTI